MRIDQLLGMPVMSVTEGLQLGKVAGVSLDPAQHRIRYLSLDPAPDRTRGVVPWSAIRAVGSAAITVDGTTEVLEAIPGTERDRLFATIGDRPVVSESGEKLGHITSYDFDPVTGHITGYRVHRSGFLGLGGQDTMIAPESLRAFGADAIIVRDEIPAAKAA